MFVDSDELRDQVSDIYDAILQLRGGGVGLVLVTRAYLSRKYCLAELRALMEFARLRQNEERNSEAITLRIMCLEAPEGAQTGVTKVLNCARERSQNGRYYPFVNGFEDFIIGAVNIELDTKNPQVPMAEQISNIVWEYWNEDNSRPSLGGRRDIAFLDMQRFFDHEDRRDLGRALGTVVEHHEEIQDVIAKAMGNGVISFYNLGPLLNACAVCGNGDAAAQAVLAFTRRWSSSSWSWSRNSHEGFRNSVREADEALEEVLSAEPAPDLRHTQNPAPPPGDPRYTVFISAEENDTAISGALYQSLSERNIGTYIDDTKQTHVAPNAATEQMYLALASARIVVFILSPHFVANDGVMNVLKYFLTRYDTGSVEDRNRSTILPVFYRVSREDCMNRMLFDWTRPDGTSFFQSQGFYDTNQTRQSAEAVVLQRLRRLMQFPGIEKVFGQWNKLHRDGEPLPGIEPREIPQFVEQIREKVIEARTRIENQ